MTEFDPENVGPIPAPKRKKGQTRKRVVTPEELEKRRSPEFLEHLKKIGRKKGDPKVPGSGSKATPKETKEWIAGKSINVAEFMFEIMNDDTQPTKERIRAAQWLGEMSMSKAPVEQKVEVNHNHDIGQMLLEAQRLASKPLIDITPLPKTIEGDKD